jgi:hypothetical protein
MKKYEIEALINSLKRVIDILEEKNENTRS